MERELLRKVQLVQLEIAKEVRRVCEENGIQYCVWNYLSTPNDGNRFSLVDDDRREILSPRLLRILQGRVD